MEGLFYDPLYRVTEVTMNDGYATQFDSGSELYYRFTDNSSWYPNSGFSYSRPSEKEVEIKVDTRGFDEAFKKLKPQVERRDEMISRKVLNEALAEAGISKKDRRKVEKLSSDDFEYLVASLLAKVFEPEMLKVFEEPIQKVKVVEE